MPPPDQPLHILVAGDHRRRRDAATAQSVNPLREMSETSIRPTIIFFIRNGALVWKPCKTPCFRNKKHQQPFTMPVPMPNAIASSLM